MTHTLILSTLINLFAISPDLCDVPYLDTTGEPRTDSIGQTLSRYCKWTGPDAPTLDSDVCCSIEGNDAACWMPDERGSCYGGSKWYCEYGKKWLGGGVECMQPFPSACDLGHCTQVQAPPQPPDVLANLICCFEGYGCELINPDVFLDCEDSGGIASWCDFGVCNEDGSVTCSKSTRS